MHKKELKEKISYIESAEMTPEVKRVVGQVINGLLDDLNTTRREHCCSNCIRRDWCTSKSNNWNCDIWEFIYGERD